MSHKQLTEQELDALVIRSLARLPHYAPARGFESRVMARLVRPEPRAVLALRRARAWAAQPRRATSLVVGYALAAVLGVLALLPRVVANAPSLGLALDWSTRAGLGLVHRMSAAFASWTLTSGVADQVQAVNFRSPMIVGSLIALSLAYAGCAIGLHLLLRSPRGRHALVTA